MQTCSKTKEQEFFLFKSIWLDFTLSLTKSRYVNVLNLAQYLDFLHAVCHHLVSIIQGHLQRSKQPVTSIGHICTV